MSHTDTPASSRPADVLNADADYHRELHIDELRLPFSHDQPQVFHVETGTGSAWQPAPDIAGRESPSV